MDRDSDNSIHMGIGGAKVKPVSERLCQGVGVNALHIQGRYPGGVSAFCMCLEVPTDSVGR